jgi:hypothetical protein
MRCCSSSASSGFFLGLIRAPRLLCWDQPTILADRQEPSSSISWFFEASVRGEPTGAIPG